MICKVLTFVCLVVVSSSGATAQGCFPEPVFDIYLEGTTLFWEPSKNCEGATYTYIVLIHAENAGVVDYAYQLDGTTLDVSFLSLCRPYIFTVSAVIEHLVSPHSQIPGIIQPPEDTSIAITNITSDLIDDDVLLQWAVPSEYTFCPDSYRLLLWSEDSAEPEEIITNQNGYLIANASRCMPYRIEASVIYRTVQQPVYRINYTVPAATNTPSLQSVIQNVLSVNTTWALESYRVNRCKVTALTVSGTGLNTTIPIQDTPERPTIDVTLTGLRANSMYYFRVTVENEAGISRPFQLAVQTLPIQT